MLRFLSSCATSLSVIRIAASRPDCPSIKYRKREISDFGYVFLDGRSWLASELRKVFEYVNGGRAFVAPTQKLPRPGILRSFPEASSSESASRTEVLLTPKSDESSRCDGSLASAFEATMSSMRVATFFESVFQFSISVPSGS